MSTLPDDAADDDDDALTCPLCGYDLRGLPEDRCPECGHAFDPASLRDARRSSPAWSFEHATSHRVRAFVGTFGRSLTPWRFWRELSPASVVVPRQLAIWSAAWLALGSLVAAGVFGMQLSAISRTFATNPGVKPTWTALVRYAPLRNRVAHDTVAIAFASLAWPLVTLAALALFGLTLRRAGIRRRHLWRCVLYAWPTTLLVASVGLVAATQLGWMPRFDSRSPLTLITHGLRILPSTTCTLLACAIVSTLHLTFAHARYLRLPHAAAQALLVGVVTWLALATLIAFGPR